MGQTPLIWWVRKDLRLADNPVLTEVGETGRPVIPVFILDEVFEGYGAAPRWRFGLGAEAFAEALDGIGSKLIFRRGPALDTLRDLIAETGADTVRWGRAYDPGQVERDKAVKAGLGDDGVDAASVPGHVMFEPWTVQTGTGGFYKVYTPFWKAVRGREVSAPLAAPDMPAPVDWPASDDVVDWNLGRPMGRGAAVVRAHCHVGEEAAQGRLGAFIAHRIETYAEDRDRLDVDGTS